jgi:hypothetical protein
MAPSLGAKGYTGALSEAHAIRNRQAYGTFTVRS